MGLSRLSFAVACLISCVAQSSQNLNENEALIAGAGAGANGERTIQVTIRSSLSTAPLLPAAALPRPLSAGQKLRLLTGHELAKLVSDVGAGVLGYGLVQNNPYLEASGAIIGLLGEGVRSVWDGKQLTQNDIPRPSTCGVLYHGLTNRLWFLSYTERIMCLLTGYLWGAASDSLLGKDALLILSAGVSVTMSLADLKLLWDLVSHRHRPNHRPSNT